MKSYECEGQLSLFDGLLKNEGYIKPAIGTKIVFIRDGKEYPCIVDNYCGYDYFWVRFTDRKPTDDAEGWHLSLRGYGESWKYESDQEQVAAVQEKPTAEQSEPVGTWVKSHGRRVLFDEIKVGQYYIADYSNESRESLKIVYTKKKVEDKLMYVDSPRGVNGEWSWGNSYSAMTRQEYIDGEEKNCSWWYELAAVEEKQRLREKYPIPELEEKYRVEERWVDDWHYCDEELPEEHGVYYCIQAAKEHYNYTYMAYAYGQWWNYGGYGTTWLLVRGERREWMRPFAWVKVPDKYYQEDTHYQFLTENFVTEKDWEYEKRMMQIREENKRLIEEAKKKV